MRSWIFEKSVATRIVAVLCICLLVGRTAGVVWLVKQQRHHARVLRDIHDRSVHEAARARELEARLFRELTDLRDQAAKQRDLGEQQARDTASLRRDRANEAPAGCTPLPKPPLTLSRPGKYCLTESVTYEGDDTAVIVAGDHIEIDLRGFCLNGPAHGAGLTTGILIRDSRHVSIHGGCFSGFYTAIRSVWTSVDDYMAGKTDKAATSFLSITNNRFHRNTFRAISLVADNAEIRDNRISETFGATVPVDATVYGILLVGDSCKIADNVIRNTYGTAAGEGIGISILNMGKGCVVERNSVINESSPDLGRTFGIFTSPKGGETVLIKENTIENVTYALGYVGVLVRNTILNASCDTIYGKHYGFYTERNNDVISFFKPATDTLRSQPPQCPDRVDNFKARAEAGNPVVMYRLAQVYGLSDDWKNAALWYALAAEFGHAYSADMRDLVKNHRLTKEEYDDVATQQRLVSAEIHAREAKRAAGRPAP